MPSKQIDNLSHQDALCLLELIHASLSCTTEEGFRDLMAGVKKLIPFEHAICLLGEKTDQNKVTRYELINISYPQEWLCHYVTKNYHLVDPIVKENFTNFSVQYWRDTYRKCNSPKQFILEAEDFGLKKGYSIGQKNLQETEGSLFSFAGICIEQHPRTEIILTHLAPHLHQSFIRLLGNDKQQRREVSLTAREQEILCWVKEGKSTWDISHILSISQDTVKFHLRNIFRKLNTSNRPHAIAIALERRLIDF